jgi:hypothetical protein
MGQFEKGPQYPSSIFPIRPVSANVLSIIKVPVIGGLLVNVAETAKKPYRNRDKAAGSFSFYVFVCSMPFEINIIVAAVKNNQ